MRKAVAMAALLISVMVSANAYAGEWKSDQNGWWYVQDDGTYIRNAWFTDKDGKSYYFGEDGYMLTDTVTPDGWVVGPDGAWVESEGRKEGRRSRSQVRKEEKYRCPERKQSGGDQFAGIRLPADGTGRTGRRLPEYFGNTAGTHP